MKWEDCLKQKPDWYGSDEAVRIADQVLLYQRDTGGWPKNSDMATRLTMPEKVDLIMKKQKRDSTIDNEATYTQIAYLAKVYTAKKLERHKDACLKGVDYLLNAQYDNGGWPQFYPDRTGYYKHITFNDDAMIGVMNVLRDIAHKKPAYAFVDEDRRRKAEKAVQKGIECILKTQVVVQGRRTVWCAQHDEVTLAPAPARTFEPVSLSGYESVGIVRFLMGIDHPDERVIEAIESAVAWFEKSKITGIRWVEKKVAGRPSPVASNSFPPATRDQEPATILDRVVIQDPTAGPLWARFYEIGTNRPIFIGRDGRIKYDVAEIDAERRNGYRWYVAEPAELLNKDYPAWQKNRISDVPNVGGGSAAPTELVVAADGSAKYKTVQEATMAVPAGSPDNPVIIRIRPGLYKELIYVQREKRFFRLVGEDAEKTVLTYHLHANLTGHDGKPIGTFRTPSTVIDADDFTAENLTFENSAGPVGQALAVRVDGDRVVFRHCRFLGWQDTIFLNRGRHYFETCTIAGHVDFIFGGATAFFERCRIHCLKDGYVTAASTPDHQPFGFVFSHCQITGETPAVKTYLGRPWRAFANVIFLDTEMSEVVRPAGGHNWNFPDREQTACYAESGSTGPGANPRARVAWARQLTQTEAKAITLEKVLGGADRWNPRTGQLRPAVKARRTPPSSSGAKPVRRGKDVA